MATGRQKKPEDQGFLVLCCAFLWQFRSFEIGSQNSKLRRWSSRVTSRVLTGSSRVGRAKSPVFTDGFTGSRVQVYYIYTTPHPLHGLWTADCGIWTYLQRSATICSHLHKK